MEIRRIPGYSPYEISDEGQVYRRLGNGSLRPVKATPKDNGYCRVHLNGDTLTVHSLVMRTFVGPRPDGMEVCHNDGIRTNNKLTNLRYDTRGNNHRDKLRHGTHNTAVLNESDVRIIRALHDRKTGMTSTKIAKFLGLGVWAVADVVTRRTWAHVS